MIGLQTTMLLTWLAAGSADLTAQGAPAAAQPTNDAPRSAAVTDRPRGYPVLPDGPAAIDAPIAVAGGLEVDSGAEPPRLRRRTGRIVAGSVMTGVGAVAASFGLMSLVLSPIASFGGGELPLGIDASFGLVLGGGVLAGVGIPTLASGFKRVPVRAATASQSAVDAGLAVGPGSLALNLQF